MNSLRLSDAFVIRRPRSTDLARISGLSNQWRTREGLLESFALGLDANSDTTSVEACRMMQRFLLHLESFDSPGLWAGTSHSHVNLVVRDVVNKFDRVPPVATIGVIVKDSDPPGCVYPIGRRLVVGKRPTNEWGCVDTADLDSATRLVLDALAYSQVPQRNARP